MSALGSLRIHWCCAAFAAFAVTRPAVADEVCMAPSPGDSKPAVAKKASAPVSATSSTGSVELAASHAPTQEHKALSLPAPKLPVAVPTVAMPLPKATPVIDSEPHSFDAWQRPIGLVVGGAGVVGLGVAGAFTLDMLTKKAQVCSGVQCRPQDRTMDDARASGKIALAAAVTGFSLAGAGAVLFLTAPAPPGVRDLKFSPTLAAGGGGISAKATFF